MVNFYITTGYFEGEIVEEGIEILDVDFFQLEDELQSAILEYAESQIGNRYEKVGDSYIYVCGNGDTLGMNILKEDYEFSWNGDETNDEPTLEPVSEW